MTQVNQNKLVIFKEAIEKQKGMLAKIAPAHMDMERFKRVGYRELVKNPQLLQCTPESFIQCLFTAAELGIEPGGALNEGYLIPFGNTCTLIVGYRGLINLARRSGQIRKIEARLVHENDYFKYSLGTDPKIEHVPNLENRGDIVAAYAVAALTDGATQFDVMSMGEINDIRKRSRAANNGPWVSDTGEMSRKTVTRRLCKYLPMSVEMATAIELDNRVDTGEGIADLIDVEPEEGAFAAPTAQTATQSLENALTKKRGRPAKTEAIDNREDSGSPLPEEKVDPEEATKLKIVKDIQMGSVLLGKEAYGALLAEHQMTESLMSYGLAELGLLKAAINRAVEEKTEKGE